MGLLAEGPAAAGIARGQHPVLAGEELGDGKLAIDAQLAGAVGQQRQGGREAARAPGRRHEVSGGQLRPEHRHRHGHPPAVLLLAADEHADERLVVDADRPRHGQGETDDGVARAGEAQGLADDREVTPEGINEPPLDGGLQRRRRRELHRQLDRFARLHGGILPPVDR